MADDGNIDEPESSAISEKILNLASMVLLKLFLLSLSAFHLYGKTGGNFPPNGTVRMEKTVVPLCNQMERFLPLAILGSEPRISPRSIVCECDEANGSVIFRLFR